MLPAKEWRFTGNRYIHDGDCQFWNVEVCTCGLLHHMLVHRHELPHISEMDPGDWFLEELAKQEHQLESLPREEKYAPPTPEEIEKRKKYIMDVFRDYPIF